MAYDPTLVTQPSEIASGMAGRMAQDSIEDQGPTVFEKYEVGSWQVGDSRLLAFPVVQISETGGNRIIIRERPFRDGAKLDDSGAKPRVWSMVTIFDNSLVADGNGGILGEPGIKETNGADDLYPTVLNELISSFYQYHREAGDLVVPTVGKVRARLQDYNREERPESQDSATVRLTFVEDNEDSVDASSFTTSTVSGSAIRVGQTMDFSAQSDLSWEENMMNINELMANLEGLANAPATYASDIDQKVGITIGALNRMDRTMSQRSVPGRNIFLDPESSVTRRKLEESKEIAYQAKYNYQKRYNVVTRVFKDPQSLMSIAAMLGQDMNTLVSLNSGLPDIFEIEPGTPVKVVNVEPGS